MIIKITLKKKITQHNNRFELIYVFCDDKWMGCLHQQHEFHLSVWSHPLRQYHLGSTSLITCQV